MTWIGIIIVVILLITLAITAYLLPNSPLSVAMAILVLATIKADDRIGGP